ncbi:hypothetical protein BpHYR1_007812 [Brachionus plicatilis]|uniref:Uncharacterized protein n=1 Tax=Brachionus plicatilis TaxID=10195 RepID=A0A3M7QHV8_BRAPC|nr:hypothetical protein BpHYR1_007812 [Brachionus plicatilis]
MTGPPIEFAVPMQYLPVYFSQKRPKTRKNPQKSSATPNPPIFDQNKITSSEYRAFNSPSVNVSIE